MKKLFTFLTVLLLASSLFAQSPEKMSYQAVIRNSENNLVTDKEVGMQISILEGSENGIVVYTETKTTTTNSNGLLSIEIGEGSDFSNINWANGPYFIKIETDPTGGTNYTITGISQLLSVPYSLHAKTAETVTGTLAETDPVFTAWDKDYDDLSNKPNLSVYATKDMANQNITNLADPVNAQDAVTKAYVDVLKAQIEELQLIVFGPDTLLEEVEDVDGNIYPVVTIGTQHWMGENLKTTKYNDGSSISTGYTDVQWLNLTTGAYTISPEATEVYGALYNWYAVDEGNLCPTGWHVPTDGEWTTLVDYVGVSLAGTKLKSTSEWMNNGNGTDEYDFSALPGGGRTANGSFDYIGYYGCWWSSTVSGTSKGWNRSMGYGSNTVLRSNDNRAYGYSVRCLKD